MTTLVVSDLHLGGRTGVDVLRHDPAALDALVGALDGVERLVLLGDVLELRHAPAREVLAAARPVLERLGAAVGEVVVAPGNHDHALVGSWLERQARERPPRLGLEQRIDPVDASWMAAEIAGWLGPRTSIAYPGLWLRDDVYATHGHYLDLHTTVPTFERLAAGVSVRQLGPLPAGADPADYEARLAPVYGWLNAAAAWAPDGRPPGGAGAAARAYREIAGGRRLRGRLLGAGLPVAVAAINRAGLGPVRADLSGPGLRVASLRAMDEVARRLRIGAATVVFGHSHRTGPLPGDDRTEWGRLLNCGSWVRGEHGPATPVPDDPYAPGGAVLVGAEGAPSVLRLLSPR